MLKNFSREELECFCGCGRVIEDGIFLHALQRLRDAYGKPMIISSGFRCPEDNNTNSSTGLSGPHTRAAVDVRISGSAAYMLVMYAMIYGFDGVGVSQSGPHEERFIHLDREINNTRPWIWTY